MTYEEIEKAVKEKENALAPYGINHPERIIWQVYVWRERLDVFIQEYFKVKLKDTQQAVARAIGQSEVSELVKSRGYGKTWLMALCALALGVLYPGSTIVTASRTGDQAMLIINKIKDVFLLVPDIEREIAEISNGKSERGTCTLKNGSRIISTTLTRARGLRAKV